MQVGETLAQYGQRWRSAPAGRWPLTWAGGSTGSVGAVRTADGADKPVRPDISWTADGDPAAVPDCLGHDRRRQAAVEVAVGSLLVLAMAAGGVYFAHRPASASVDGWFLDVISTSSSPFFRASTPLRYPVIIIAGSIVASGIAFRRDRPRAVACLVGPPLALFLAESMVKPVVGRTFGGALSYPVGLDGRCCRAGHRLHPGHAGPLEGDRRGRRIGVRPVGVGVGDHPPSALSDRCTGRLGVRRGRRPPGRRAGPDDRRQRTRGVDATRYRPSRSAEAQRGRAAPGGLTGTRVGGFTTPASVVRGDAPTPGAG